MSHYIGCGVCESPNFTEQGRGKSKRIKCEDCGYNGSKVKLVGKFPEQSVEKKVVVITSAQNATPVFDAGWKSLNNYVKARNAQLLVIPFRYKNPTSQWTMRNVENEWWNDEVEPYLCNQDLKINDNYLILGSLKIQPTAKNPLQGVQNLSGHASAIIGHPQAQQEALPTSAGAPPKMVSTTGCITKLNYTDTKAGKQGAFHHDAGAIVVEIENDKIAHIRHLLIDGAGCFYDLNIRCTPKGIQVQKETAGFVSGDLHGVHHDPENAKAVWLDSKSIVKRCKPKKQVFHDVLDMHWGSHHHRKDPFLQIEKYHNGKNLAKTEILETISLVNKLSICPQNYIAGSNHNEHFGKWLKEHDWRTDPANAEVYLETSLAFAKAAREGDSGDFDPLEFWAKKLKMKKLKFLKRTDSLMIADIEASYHGDQGPNGARGSAKAFDRIGTRTVIGHSHTPRREKGCVQVGTSSLMDLIYNRGSPSSWMHAHALIHKNSKVQLIIVLNGNYCAHWKW